MCAAVAAAGSVVPVTAQTPSPSSRPAAQRPAVPAQPPSAPQVPGAAPAGAARQPEAGSGPVLAEIELAFPRQGGTSVIDPQTYLYYIQVRPSRPSAGFWVPWNDETEKVVLDDFKRLWATNFLDDLSIRVEDRPYPNGVVGKRVIFEMEERPRVKIVDYVGSKKLEQSKIDEKLKEKGITIRLDSFIDQGLIRRVDGVVREMLAEKGYHDGRVTHEMKDVGGGPKLVHLTFTIDEGPQYKIKSIDFIGNDAVGDGRLTRKMKENKPQWAFSFITGRGTYLQDKFEEDADKLVEYYRDKGYITARIGQPEVKTLEDAPDGRQRFVELRVPVTEGRRYRVGNFTFDGNTVVKPEGLRPLFKLKEGQFYAEKHIRKGLEKAREVYGSGGYFEFTGFPDLSPRDQPKADDPAAAEAPPADPNAPAVVDVTMRMQEGKQYFVNRITFVGNSTTRDNVIRREIRLYENGVFNTEALKFSVKRLNQLGYFKNLEGDAIGVDKTPGADNKVDVTLKLEEQNRNQLTFGAGVSQFEGFFGQLAFQTANFLGKGETLTLSLQAGSRTQNYQLAFTEPYLFDRPITGGFDLYKREIKYYNQFTQASAGGNLVVGFPVRDFTRAFVNYSLENVEVKDLNELYTNGGLTENNPFLADALLVKEGGKRTISKIVPSIVYNTIDNPIFPTSGKRLSASIDLAGIGGNVNFIKPRLETVGFFQHTRRTSFGARAQFEMVKEYGSTKSLPIFERLFLGGEYSIRGFDLRSVGPRDPNSFLVIGGNKSLLFNFEYLISIAGPVRLVLFYDAGQVPDFVPEPAKAFVPFPTSDISSVPNFLFTPIIPSTSTGSPTTLTYQGFGWDNFKTSTGAEIRFFMPVLNVPFRLIFAYNPQRQGIFDNNLQPQKRFTFRFAVGSTF